MRYFIICLFLFSLAFARLDRYFFKTGGSFCPNFILPKWSRCPQFDTGGIENPPECLNQTFTYWTKGKQSFVFLSENKKWILKCVRLPKFARYGNFRGKKSTYLEQTLEGYKWAHDALSEETGVVYAHLKPTEFLKTKIKLVDKFQNIHIVNLDHLPFIMQKVGDPFFSVFEKKTAKQMITKTIALYSKLYDKGFIDNDPIFDKNLGIINDSPIILDIGQIQKTSTLPPKRRYLLDMTQSLSTKLEREDLELYNFYKNLLP